MKTMNALSVTEVVAKIRDLPSLPVLIMDLLNTIGKENVDIKSLAESVSHDQALTAKVLRLANSTFYGMSRKVRTIPQAISVLGFETVRTLITAAAVTDHFFGNDKSNFNFTAFWRHALGTAVCARVLARTLHVNQEYAFVAGLLHDIGRLVLVTFFSKQYDAVLAYRAEHDCYLFEAERQVLQVDHAVIGEALTQAWKFPEAMQRAVAHHHRLRLQADDSLAAIVHVADVLSHALDLSSDDEDLVPPLSQEIWNSLGISEGTMMQILRETETQFSEASQVLVV
jgi:putative nucleotidyltransferase with HDIG domain